MLVAGAEGHVWEAVGRWGGEQGPRQGPAETDHGPGSVTAAGSIVSQSRGDTRAPSPTLQLGCVFTLCLKTAGVCDQGVAWTRTLDPLIESLLSPLADRKSVV